MKRIATLLLSSLLLSTIAVPAQDNTKIASAEKKTYKKSAEVQPSTFNTIYDMLRMEPGVMISGDTSGGSRPGILIRGISTNSGNTEPLFVVDGTIVEDISYLLPSMVAQIEVLKDATSAIYGIRGGNGVIMITTVSAKEELEAEERALREAKEAAKAEKRMLKQVKKSTKK